MPMYDFRCKKCGHKFTVITGINDRDKVTCPECRTREVEQLITGCSVLSGPGLGSGCGHSHDSGTRFRGG